MRASCRVTAGAVAVGLALLVISVIVPFRGHAQSGRGGNNRLIDNERVTVQRLTAAAGLTEQMHLTPQDIVAIQATPGDIEMAIGSERTTGGQWKVWYLPQTVEHALFNRGTQPVDMIVVMLK